ncbi:MAG: hypothetical protein ACO2PN_20555 [Pyrobaculum sp.]|jgi:hypothetical protein
MICKELVLICAACRKRHVNIIDRGGEIIVYADLLKELFDTVMRQIVEMHVSKCAGEIADALSLNADRYGWREADGKMRFFYVVKKS